MGLFSNIKKIFNKKSDDEIIKEKIEEDFGNKSLSELSLIIGGGEKYINWGSTGNWLHEHFQGNYTTDYTATYCLVEIYLKKLVSSNETEGGFGIDGGDEIIKTVDALNRVHKSVCSDGVYQRFSKVKGPIIQNYMLEFLKNYLLNGNRAVLYDEFDLISSIFYNTQNKIDTDGMILTKGDISNINSPIYDNWIYHGSTEFILAKIRLAIRLGHPRFVIENGLYIDGDRNKGYMTIDSFKHIDNLQDLLNYLDDCQTENLD